MDEAVLIQQARQGDRAAFGQLVRLHRDAVYRFAARWLADPDQALDVAQDVFVRAFNGLSNYRGDSRFRTWLFSITLNTARSVARRQKRRGEVRIDTGAEFIASLTPEKQRGAVTLRVFEGLSFKEIGEIIGCSEGSARVNYHHGIQKLREALT
jgi:RNA polymerase sigma-70 factor (ECF subfamily)